YEKDVRKFPSEYLWNYKIWKYTDEKQVLIISDGKAGHLHQSQAAAALLSEALAQRRIKASISTVEIRLKNKLSKTILAVAAFFSGKYSCQGCMSCLRMSLATKDCQILHHSHPDFVISCGSLGSMVNRMVSRENLSKSITILKPAFAGLRKFDLVVMPRHDRPRRKKNVAVIEGALNLIDKNYLAAQVAGLVRVKGEGLSGKEKILCIGLLIGGDTKNFRLSKEDISLVIAQIKQQAESINADILVTTSRRTPAEIEELVKKEFSAYPRCKLLVIANEKNIPGTMEAILGSSDIAVVSAESISMVSEAASSGKYVIVFESAVDAKHRRFLNNMGDKKYIYLIPAQAIGEKIGF
ncbi:MAG: ELM1/GtrOC1 family putative glycosyltransferase, partial [Candidatus Omnitrophica bacterium]|nr:ELM1/GtrOC1 family putative glycosyltransferase [Candidatus Omnitrophota bacterium]